LAKEISLISLNEKGKFIIGTRGMILEILFKEATHLS
jgi:hypothetical protein